jgi:hypothetical protein
MLTKKIERGHAVLQANGHAASSGYGLIGEGDYSRHLAFSLTQHFPFAGS